MVTVFTVSVCHKPIWFQPAFRLQANSLPEIKTLLPAVRARLTELPVFYLVICPNPNWFPARTGASPAKSISRSFSL
jgi:hypothetical protein